MCVKMDDKIQDHNHNQELDEVLETLSLTDFPTTQQDHQDHRNPPSPPPPPTGEYFEFFRRDLGDFSDDKLMSHAEDIIFCGKLIPINQQKKPPKNPPEKHRRRQPILCRRSESMSEIKTPPATGVVRTSRSLDYKKLHRNSNLTTSEPAPDIGREGSGKKSSFRWYVFLFGLVKLPPPEMDLRDIKNRQVRRSSSKTFVSGSDSGELVAAVNRSNDDDDHRKCSWRVLGLLSCKSSSASDGVVTTSLRYVHKV